MSLEMGANCVFFTKFIVHLLFNTRERLYSEAFILDNKKINKLRDVVKIAFCKCCTA